MLNHRKEYPASSGLGKHSVVTTLRLCKYTEVHGPFQCHCLNSDNAISLPHGFLFADREWIRFSFSMFGPCD